MDILPFATTVNNDGDFVGGAWTTDERLDLLPVEGCWLPAEIIPGPVIGRGRAAQARLVEAIGADGESILVVEKTFAPGWLTRIVYRAAFQAPFAYQHTRDAIVACYFRRRVAAAIVAAMAPDVRVAMPLYIRFDREAKAWVLGTEFIRGRGIRPAPADPRMLRQWLARFLWGPSVKRRRREEVTELLQSMSALEWTFRSCGLLGAGWQVCPRALVSTANLLRTDGGYALVDLESGMPAVMVGRYVWDGLRIGSPPVFDDVDGPRLWRWLDARRQELVAHLGRDGNDALRDDAARLIRHTRRWKKSELAWQRNRTAIVGTRFRRAFNERLVDTWLRSGLIDEAAAGRMQSGGDAFRRVTFALGLLPGRLGRFLQRCWANRPYRARVGRFLRDGEYRREVLQAAVQRRAEKWRYAGRISPSLRLPRIGPLFLVLYVLSHLTPAGVQRWLTDPVRRRDMAARWYLLCVSARFQSAYGRHVVGEMVRRWRRQQRITRPEAERLYTQLDDNDLDEYLRCMGMHVGLKFFLPLFAPLKASGVAATLATGNPLYLLPLLAMPACRTAVTVWRMAHPARRHIRYVEALSIGALPVVGSLAYPVQMRARHPELSELILRDAASQIGRIVPIYGGTDSRVEIWAIKSVNLVLEGMDLLHAITRPLERLFARGSAKPRPADEPAAIPFRKRAKLEARQIALLAAAESPDVSPAEAAWADWNERTSRARAA